MYKAVIFDLDGTLLDTISDISDSVNAVLSSMGHSTFSESQYKYFVGMGVDELIKTVMRENGIIGDEFDTIKSGYIQEYAKRNSIKTKPYDGILDMLRKLKDSGVKICILSNKPHFQTEEVVAKYFDDIAFDVVFGKKPEYKIKPDPESALKILEILGITQAEALYVGDTNTDMQTAINAGIKSVGVLWGFRTMNELIAAGAGYIINDPKNILSIVGGMGNDSQFRELS
ncbi:MAG TPA: HAD family hydrolase [Bacillota bacterium]|nr:HAD family hydrolase [Bacillota bacterium]